MATLSSLRNAVASEFGMDNDEGSTDRTLIDEWLNEGVREILVRTHCYQTASTMDTTADEWQYTLNDSILNMVHVWRDGSNETFERVAPEEIIDRRQYLGAEGTFTKWAISGTNLFLIFPTPSEAFTLELIYVPRPAEMTFDTHDPADVIYGGIPVEFHHGIKLWAMSRAGSHEQHRTSQGGLVFRQEFESYMHDITRALSRKGGQTLARSRVGRRRYLGLRNDVYPSR